VIQNDRALHQPLRNRHPADVHLGNPDLLHVDHGSDSISAHLEQVMADLRTGPAMATCEAGGRRRCRRRSTLA
jgi:hypothetical protein